MLDIEKTTCYFNARRDVATWNFQIQKETILTFKTTKKDYFWGQFHQHFTLSFLPISFCFWQSQTVVREKLSNSPFVQKTRS